ncbi:MAG: AraD1 family protein [Balneolaceae bacterium]|nr:AraD1 family protein [Balneolaceae bacterium]
MRLIQLTHPEKGRRTAAVHEPNIQLIDDAYRTCYQLIKEVVEEEKSASRFIESLITEETLNYDEIYQDTSDWSILPAFDHPESPLSCILSGTGLTHKASAENRQKMHEKMETEGNATDSMEMYLWGEEGGKPKVGEIGVQPEWFYKGNGTALKGHNDALPVPAYADDGGEEPELAGIYYVSSAGNPVRIGFAIANEFSDHVMEKKNYLYLAPSKLRTPAIGPELVIGQDFKNIPGKVSVYRKGKVLWSKQIKTGEENMSHSLRNLEYHHFKYEQHRVPGMVHIHFYGADAFSFGGRNRLAKRRHHGDLISRLRTSAQKQDQDFGGKRKTG